MITLTVATVAAMVVILAIALYFYDRHTKTYDPDRVIERRTESETDGGGR